MASIITCSVNQSIRAERNKTSFNDDQHVSIRIGSDTVAHISREEAVRFAAEVLDAAGVEPAEVAA